MTRIIAIHVGPHKTGTTLIQRSLRKLAPELASAGWTVPDPSISDAESTAALNFVALEVMGHTQHPWLNHSVPSGRLQAVASWLANTSSHAVLSAEEFSRLSPVQVHGFREAVYSAAVMGAGSRDVQLRIIVGARHYRAVSRSIWGQLIVAGVETRPLAEFQDAFLCELSRAEDPLGESLVDRSQPDLRPLRLPWLIRLWSDASAPVILPISDARLLTVQTDADLVRAFLQGASCSEVAVGTRVDEVMRDVTRDERESMRNRRRRSSLLAGVLEVNRANDGLTRAEEFLRRAEALERDDHPVDAADFAPNPEAERGLDELFARDMHTLAKFRVSVTSR